MKGIKIMRGIIVTALTVPIWVYLVYQILVRVNASELMWFLFWVYVPAVILVSMLTMLIEEK